MNQHAHAPSSEPTSLGVADAVTSGATNSRAMTPKVDTTAVAVRKGRRMDGNVMVVCDGMWLGTVDVPQS